jgi:hypothetical protein
LYGARQKQRQAYQQRQQKTVTDGDSHQPSREG